jgi:hypothetical protein
MADQIIAKRFRGVAGVGQVAARHAARQILISMRRTT